MDTVVATTTESTTPVSTPETSSAAPAISAPSSSSSTSERPTDVRSLASYMAKLDQQSSAVPDPASPVKPETAATVPPADASAEPVTHPNAKQGPIPFEAHKTALDNARAKERDAVAKEWAPYAWAKSIQPEVMREWSATAQKMSSDPIGFLTDFVRELEAHPTHAAQLRSHAGRILSAGRSAPQPLAPDVEVRDDAGNVVARTFSAERMQTIVQQTIADALGKELQPIKQERQQEKARHQAAETARVAETKADALMATVHDILEISDDLPDARKQALFTAVNAEWTAHPDWDLRDVARSVWKQHVRPTLDQRAQAKALDSFKTKAAGNTANGAGASATPGKLKTREDLARFLRSRSGS